MIYIATFYSHFGAMRFKKLCDGRGIAARCMPVPRDLSSSCGTCVRYEGAPTTPFDDWSDEVEQVVSTVGGTYRVIYWAENG